MKKGAAAPIKSLRLVVLYCNDPYSIVFLVYIADQLSYTLVFRQDIYNKLHLALYTISLSLSFCMAIQWQSRTGGRSVSSNP